MYSFATNPAVFGPHLVLAVNYKTLAITCTDDEFAGVCQNFDAIVAMRPALEPTRQGGGAPSGISKDAPFIAIPVQSVTAVVPPAGMTYYTWSGEAAPQEFRRFNELAAQHGLKAHLAFRYVWEDSQGPKHHPMWSVDLYRSTPPKKP